VVRYSNLQELLEDAERLAQRPVRTLGNWSQGQIYKHLAVVMKGSLDGIPMTTPWYIRLILKPFKKRILSKPMSPGFNLNAKAAAVIVPGPTEIQEGLDLMRTVIKRLQAEPQRHPSPFLGKLTADEYNQLFMRHAELHMSFIVEA
jgi:hypothetical protein